MSADQLQALLGQGGEQAIAALMQQGMQMAGQMLNQSGISNVAQSTALSINGQVVAKNMRFFVPNARPTVWEHIAVRVDFLEAGLFALGSMIYQLFFTALYGVGTLFNLCAGCAPELPRTMKQRLLSSGCAAGAFGVAMAGVVLPSLGQEGTMGIVGTLIKHADDINGFLGQPAAQPQEGEAD